jgi:hypothetical protein
MNAVGGKDYLPLLCSLNGETPNRKILFYNAMRAPQAPGWKLQRFETKTRTNWHYECAGAFLDFGVSKNAKLSDLGHWTNGRKEEDRTRKDREAEGEGGQERPVAESRIEET